MSEVERMHARINSIIARSEAEERDLTPSEADECEFLCSEIATISSEKKQGVWKAGSLEKLKAKLSDPNSWPEGPVRDKLAASSNGGSGPIQPSGYDSAGRPIYMLSKNQKVADVIPGKKVAGGFGELIRAVVTGRRDSRMHDSVRMALDSSTNSAGGFLVPGELASEVIDKARAVSVVMQAGARIVPMQTSELTMARVLSDPTFTVKAQNDAFPDANVTFGAVNFTAHTIGCVITASRELAEDAPNFAEIIEGVIARALAVRLDYYACQGVAPAPLGLVGNPAISETGSIGALAWEDLAAASSEVKQANHNPSAIILGVEPYEDLQILAGGDGVNASKAWLMAPPALDGQQILATNNMPLANAICGDFSYAVWGIRADSRIETSVVADDAFERHQVKMKIVFRGDFQVVDPSAFHRLAGITS